MIFVCALVPVASLAVSLAFGGGFAPFVLLISLLLLPLLRGIRLPIPITVALVSLSLFFRALSIANEAVGALGFAKSVIIAAAVLVASGISAHNRNSAKYISTPIFFITALLAVYIVAVSFGGGEADTLTRPSGLEAVSASLCAVSYCLSVGELGEISGTERIKGAVIGTAVCCVLLLFKSASAEFGFISVPLACAASAVELSAVISRIKGE